MPRRIHSYVLLHQCMLCAQKPNQCEHDGESNSISAYFISQHNEYPFIYSSQFLLLLNLSASLLYCECVLNGEWRDSCTHERRTCTLYTHTRGHMPYATICVVRAVWKDRKWHLRIISSQLIQWVPNSWVRIIDIFWMPSIQEPCTLHTHSLLNLKIIYKMPHFGCAVQCDVKAIWKTTKKQNEWKWHQQQQQQ